MQHPSDHTLARFAAATLDARELLEVDDHLAQCDRCRLRAAGGITPADVARKWETVLAAEERPRRTMLYGALAAAAVLAVIFAALLARKATTGRPHVTPIAKAPSSTPASPITTTTPELRDDGATYRLGESDQVLGLPADLEPVLVKALAGELPRIVAVLNPPVGRPRGSTTPAMTTKLIEPVGEVIAGDRPLFRWSGGEGRRKVQVFDARLREIAASEWIDGEQWRPSSALPRNQVLSWQLSIEQDGEVTIAPQPPSPPARFTIIDADAATRLEQARGHLAKGLIYFREGMIDDAERELAELERLNPGAELPKRLRAAVRGQGRPTITNGAQ